MVLGFAILACLARSGLAGQQFLSGSVRGSARARTVDVEDVLLGELAVGLRHYRGGSAVSRLEEIEAALRPTLAALPKNAQGNLDHAVVRYALHRLFVQRHGWFVKGLEPEVHPSNVSSPVDILQDAVPAYIQSLYEARLGTQGLGLRDLAVLAATLEHLVHDETMGRLRLAYGAQGLSLTDRIDAEQVDGVVETYMMSYLHGANLSMSREAFATVKARVEKGYLGWDDIRMWTQDVRRSVAYAGRSNPFLEGQLRFSDTARVIETLNDQYGRHQDLECRTLKELLIEYEDGDRGRVRLSEFYRAQLSGEVPPAFQLTETADFLRALGALDESDPAQPSVIMPNYLNARSNCLASSNFYTVCCIDECEGLLGQLEASVGAPFAPPEQLARLVSLLRSDTVEAPRVLSAALLDRLQEIARAHGGLVPLHGRLFAQWLHHAYPRECVYPHAAGEGSPQTPDEWMDEKERSTSRDEMKRYAANSSASVNMERITEAAIPWSPEELLLGPAHAPPGPASAPWGGGGAWLFQLALLASGAFTLARTFRSSLGSVHRGKPLKPSAGGMSMFSGTQCLDKLA